MFIALYPSRGGFSCLDSDGSVSTVKDLHAVSGKNLLVLNKKMLPGLSGAPFVFDLLELFAFIYPAKPIVPTLSSFKKFFGIEEDDPTSALFLLFERMLQDIPKDADSYALLLLMQTHGWPFAPLLLERLEKPEKPGSPFVWQRLPEWENTPLPAPHGTQPVTPLESANFLSDLLAQKQGLEARPEQMAYAETAPYFLQSPDQENDPKTLLIEAGTGVGKTLGYLAPLLLFAEKNTGSFWISTYTKNLQHQIDEELSFCFSSEEEKDRQVTLKKGRENYLCILNFEEAMHADTGQTFIYLALMTRWISATKTGDLSGGDCPSWLLDLLPKRTAFTLADRRGECLYAACPHYRRCFIERINRKAQRTPIVITNHALSIITLANATMRPDPFAPSRLIMDEAHHIFDAADSEFTAKLSLAEFAHLRRFIQGRTDGKRKQRGLKKRFEEFAAVHQDIAFAVDELINASNALPRPDSLSRILSHTPATPLEHFFAGIFTQVMARTTESDQKDGYALETHRLPLVPEVEKASPVLEEELSKILTPAKKLLKTMSTILVQQMDDLTEEQRQNLENLCSLIQMRVVDPLSVLVPMLTDIQQDTPDGFIDWFALEKIDGHLADIAYERHFIDPTLPMAETFTSALQGTLMTSATLKDRTPLEDDFNWQQALSLTGAKHFPSAPEMVSLDSPFNYKGQSRVFIITDVSKTDPRQIAQALFHLFKASGGGGLGLFTSIARLKTVYGILKPLLDKEDIPLLAQHLDSVSLPSLLNLFKAEEDSCLLGTDAVRDGVDVPGKSLRMLVFDRVPWPRPTIAHGARRAAFGKDAYDRRIVRLKVAQAFGRLIRKKTDKGVFVMLDRALPSDIATAFPKDVIIEKIGIKEAIEKISEFFASL